VNPFQNKLPVWIGKYLAAAGITLLTMLILIALQERLSSSTVALVFLLPVGLSTSLVGLGPGILSAVCAFFAINYFFIPPYYTLQVHQAQDILVLLVFLLVAVVISQLVGRAQFSLDEARARERETTWLFELSISLSRLNDDASIVRALAEKVIFTLRAVFVRITLEGSADLQEWQLSFPEDANAPAQRPALLIPLETARGLLGEIDIWRAAQPVLPAEERLARAYASQAALALERARLSQADTRARVLEESDRLKSALLSSVSHDLRTPLATIKASVTSLLSDESIWDSEVRQVLLAAIEEETDHLNLLVGNLLDMSRIEAGAIQPQKKWNTLAEIVSGVVHHIQRIARSHPIINEISFDLPLVPVDYAQMERVFTNLIGNSIKYSPENTPIRIQANTVDDQTMLIQVTNQGPPVPKEHLDRIFDKFHRVTAAERITGTGLGLSICKGFIEAHGGKIWAENLPDGIAFLFTLPLTLEGASLRLPEET
jgi:two-component system, OmpR family, sensor histidine kinase KdpD